MLATLGAMRTELRAAALYAALVFLAGFVMGAVRTMVAVPLMGRTAAVLVEAPLMLTISWFVCGPCVASVPHQTGPRARTGVVAFLLLMALEATLASLLGRSPAAWVASLGRPDGLIGLSAQILFGLTPLVRGPGLSAAWPRRSPRPPE